MSNDHYTDMLPRAYELIKRGVYEPGKLVTHPCISATVKSWPRSLCTRSKDRRVYESRRYVRLIPALLVPLLCFRMA